MVGVGEGRKPGVPSLGRPRQENCCGFEAHVGYVVGPSSKAGESRLLAMPPHPALQEPELGVSLWVSKIKPKTKKLLPFGYFKV